MSCVSLLTQLHRSSPSRDLKPALGGELQQQFYCNMGIWRWDAGTSDGTSSMRSSGISDPSRSTRSASHWRSESTGHSRKGRNSRAPYMIAWVPKINKTGVLGYVMKRWYGLVCAFHKTILCLPP